MSEKPILFSAPMVRAILEGKKTQTRRIVKPQPADHEWIEKSEDEAFRWYFLGEPNCGSGSWDISERSYVFKCPYGTVGDSLWVREAFSPHGFCDLQALGNTKPSKIAECKFVVFMDGGQKYRDGIYCKPLDKYADGAFELCKFKPSIYLPRWASRINLLIKSIRVERLQDISEADAKAEGLASLTKDGNLFKYGIPKRDGLPGADGWQWQDWCANPIDAYKKLWESINGADSWKANPWVWVVEFEVMK